jgi:hypothetical protein
LRYVKLEFGMGWVEIMSGWAVAAEVTCAVIGLTHISLHSLTWWIWFIPRLDFSLSKQHKEEVASKVDTR